MQDKSLRIDRNLPEFSDTNLKGLDYEMESNRHRNRSRSIARTWAMAQAPKTESVKMDDQRIEKILAQNEKILKSQEEILRTLRELQQDVTVLKFRGH